MPIGAIDLLSVPFTTRLLRLYRLKLMTIQSLLHRCCYILFLILLQRYSLLSSASVSDIPIFLIYRCQYQTYRHALVFLQYIVHSTRKYHGMLGCEPGQPHGMCEIKYRIFNRMIAYDRMGALNPLATFAQVLR